MILQKVFKKLELLLTLDLSRKMTFLASLFWNVLILGTHFEMTGLRSEAKSVTMEQTSLVQGDKGVEWDPTQHLGLCATESHQ